MEGIIKNLILTFILLFGFNLQAQETVTFKYDHDRPDSNWVKLLEDERDARAVFFFAYMQDLVVTKKANDDANFWYVLLIDEEVYDAPLLIFGTDQKDNLQNRINGWAPFEIINNDTIALVANSIIYRQITIDKSNFRISLAIDEDGSMTIRNPTDAFMTFTFPEKVYRSKSKKLQDLRKLRKKIKNRRQ